MAAGGQAGAGEGSSCFNRAHPEVTGAARTELEV